MTFRMFMGMVITGGERKEGAPGGFLRLTIHIKDMSQRSLGKSPEEGTSLSFIPTICRTLKKHLASETHICPA